MDIRQLTETVSVSPQLSTSDIEAAATSGFKAIINNRPDGEGFDQPAGDEIKAAAEAHGLAYQHIPITPGQMSEDDVSAFARALEDLDGPVLAFCKTGTRSSMMWALSQAGHRDVEDIIRTAREAGYDLSGLSPQLQARAGQS